MTEEEKKFVMKFKK